MKLQPLPLDSPAKDRVDWSIRVAFPSGEVCHFEGVNVTVADAADRLEVAIDEIRAGLSAVKEPIA